MTSFDIHVTGPFGGNLSSIELRRDGRVLARCNADLTSSSSRSSAANTLAEQAGLDPKEILEHLNARSDANTEQDLDDGPPFPPESAISDEARVFEDATAALDGEAQASSKPDSIATRLINLACQLYDLGRSTDGEPFVVRKEGNGVAWMLVSDYDQIQADLQMQFFEREGLAASPSALAAALSILKCKANQEPTRAVSLRVGASPEHLWLDLGTEDGKAVRIDAEGWVIVDRPGVLFRRSKLTGALPAPHSDGSLEGFSQLLNLPRPAFDLLVVWLVGCLRPGIPQPIALLEAPQGSGKSTAARLITRLIDPGNELISPPKGPEQWAVIGPCKRILALDNLSSVPVWFSEALCRAVTGESSIERQLYTTGTPTVTTIQPAILLTSIDPGGLRGDLIDRLLLLKLEPIQPSGRRTDSEIQRDFELVWSKLLGGLLNLTVKVLRTLKAIKPPAELSRMASFCVLANAVDQVRGSSALAAYLAQTEDLQTVALDSSPLSAPLIALVQPGEPWRGTASELAKALRRQAPELRVSLLTGAAIGAALKRLEPALRQAGVGIHRYRMADRARTRMLVLHAVEEVPEEIVHTVQTVQVEQGSTGAEEQHALPVPAEAPPEVLSQATHTELADGLTMPADGSAQANLSAATPSESSNEEYGGRSAGLNRRPRKKNPKQRQPSLFPESLEEDPS